MKLRGVMCVVIFLVLASFVVAPDTLFCLEDVDCSSLGDNFLCDLNVGECVEVDVPEELLEEEILIDEELFAEIEGSENVGEVLTDEELFAEIDGEGIDYGFVPSEPSFEDQLAVLQNRFIVLDTRVSDMESTGSALVIENLQTELLDLRSQVESLNTQVQIITLDTQQDLDQALSGLAILQEELTGTQSQLSEVEEEILAREKKAALYRTLATIAIIFFVFVALTYYILSHKRGHVPKTDVPAKIRMYITKEIQQGKSYGQIHQDLRKAGWSERHIREAYEQTSRKNYEEYLKSTGQSTKKSHFAPHQTNKIIAITFITIGILGIFVFFVSNSTGQAYYTGISEGEFSVLSKNLLEVNVANNDFYSLIPYADICVQIAQDDLDVSYRIIKTPTGDSVTVAPMPCTADPSYDFALKFNSWNTYSTLMGGINCYSATAAHATGGVYVLPSRYVAPGFTTTAQDYSSFCTALTLCASQPLVSSVMGSVGC